MKEEKLVNDFIKQAELQGKYIESSDSQNANKAYAEIVKVIKEMHAIDTNLSLLEELLNHKNASVKSWAAAILLFTDKKNKAVKVLKKVAKAKGLVALGAEMTLSEWGKGELKPLYDLA